uniref:Uncharacterized protein n=1 Tax=Lasius niger TaxID=67767 RepID=A0A0J7KH77_LASNI|nr:hypothetical protein RF55_10524 [Lasius niger]
MSIQYLQKIDIEEADGRIMLHIAHIVKENNTKILISFYDTDVVVMALYYLHHYQVIGLQELLITWGTGAKKRLIPLHRVATSHGYDLCSILPVLHHLTGSDYTNKVGKGKKAALQAYPTEFLKDFAHDTSTEAVAEALEKSEQYLVQVKKTAHSKLSISYDLRHMK